MHVCAVKLGDGSLLMEKYHKPALDGLLVLSSLRWSSSIKPIKTILNYILNILQLLLYRAICI